MVKEFLEDIGITSLIGILVFFLIFILFVRACVIDYKDSKALVETDTIIDVRYNHEYEEVVTKYINKYNWMEDEYQLVPEMSTVHHPECYELLHRVAYDNGKIEDIWKQCTRKEYEDVKKELGYE